MGIEELKAKEKKLLDKIDSLNGDFFLIYGPARQLEEVRAKIENLDPIHKCGGE